MPEVSYLQDSCSGSHSRWGMRNPRELLWSKNLTKQIIRTTIIPKKIIGLTFHVLMEKQRVQYIVSASKAMQTIVSLHQSLSLVLCPSNVDSSPVQRHCQRLRHSCGRFATDRAGISSDPKQSWPTPPPIRVRTIYELICMSLLRSMDHNRI